MKTKIIRVAEGKNSTLSHLYIDGIFLFFLHEDKIRAVKIMKQTAIPEGIFRLRLNTWGGMNKTYFPKYGPIHKGMIEIADLPTFSAVYIHVGNTIVETAGCPLVGLSYIKKDGEYQVLQSADAYRQVYRKLYEVATCKDNQIEISNNFQF